MILVQIFVYKGSGSMFGFSVLTTRHHTQVQVGKLPVEPRIVSHADAKFHHEAAADDALIIQSGSGRAAQPRVDIVSL